MVVPPDHLRNRSGFQWRAAVGADSAAFAAVLTSSSGSLRPRRHIRHCPVAADQREDYTRPASLKPEIAQGRVIVGTATQRPMIPTFALFDWQVIDAGDT